MKINLMPNLDFAKVKLDAGFYPQDVVVSLMGLGDRLDEARETVSQAMRELGLIGFDPLADENHPCVPSDEWPDENTIVLGED